MVGHLWLRPIWQFTQFAVCQFAVCQFAQFASLSVCQFAQFAVCKFAQFASLHSLQFAQFAKIIYYRHLGTELKNNLLASKDPGSEKSKPWEIFYLLNLFRQCGNSNGNQGTTQITGVAA